MKPEFARALSDAIVRTRHPRLDYRTEEAIRYVGRSHSLFRRHLFTGCRALDLGCGAGKFTFELERFGARATGLDCSKEAVHLAREIAAAIGSSAEFHLGVFENMPFPKSSFDFVIFPQNIIECSYDEMDTIACQVGNILAPGGKFCLEMRDALEHIGGTEGVKGSFDVITGTRQNQIYVPDEGEFPYEVTFWTVSFARFVVSRYLNFSGIEREDDNLYVLLFEKPIDKMTTNS